MRGIYLVLGQTFCSTFLCIYGDRQLKDDLKEQITESIPIPWHFVLPQVKSKVWKSSWFDTCHSVHTIWTLKQYRGSWFGQIVLELLKPTLNQMILGRSSPQIESELMLKLSNTAWYCLRMVFSGKKSLFSTICIWTQAKQNPRNIICLS